MSESIAVEAVLRASCVLLAAGIATLLVFWIDGLVALSKGRVRDTKTATLLLAPVALFLAAVLGVVVSLTLGYGQET